MPRASGSGKRQQGSAGHRDSRQDTGLVGPSTKRATPKKSHSHLEGAAAARAAEHVASHAPPLSLPAQQPHTSQQQQQQQQQTTAAPNGFVSPQAFNKNHGLAGANASTELPIDQRRLGDHPFSRPSVTDYSETSSESCISTMGGNGVVEAGHRQIDVNALKNTDVHKDSGPLELAASVLKSLPMQDTLAILIILMHVPSLSLTILYTAFTFLTFFPPVTTSSGMNINLAEIFDGSSTMPSLVTIGCMDLFFLLVWLFLWQPLQEIILDFAKPVIAITLGGGTSAKSGTSRGITTCFTWVLFHHLVRGTRSHWSRLAHHIPEEWRLPAFFSDSLNPATTVYDKRNPYGLVRSVLAIHILTQGIVRYVRGWYLRRERIHSGTGASDPESGKPPGGIIDGANEVAFNNADTEFGLPQAHHPATAKKRRKQSAQVRLQQPLWAALASTKIVVMKEYELSHATSETAGTNATDIHNLGNAPFDRQPRQIWISYIGSDEVCFSTSHFPKHSYERDPESTSTNGHTIRPAGIDESKPFYVRVNNALWQPTRIFSVDDADDKSDDDDGNWTRWTGDIYGLRPSSKYVCEFVDSRTEQVIFKTSIRTIPEALREIDGIPSAVPESKSLQPDSPTTTLKTSIAAAEARLAEEKNKLKSMRKDWKTKINALRKDNELTDNQLSSASNHDEKYKQKIRQQETQKAQAERDTEALAEQLKHFDTAPELVERKKKVERAYSAEKKLFDAAQKEFKDYKAKLEAEVKAKEVEKSNLNTRRNKVATRIAKVETELSHLTDANNRGLDEVERRRQERAIWEGQCANIASNYEDRIAQVRDANASRSEHIRHAQTQLSSFHEYINSANGLPYDSSVAAVQQQHYHHQRQLQQGSTWNPNPAAAPHFPTGMWDGSSTDLMQNAPASSAGRGVGSVWPPAPMAAAFEPRPLKLRGRSSSMLSDVSGFTQSTDEDFTASPMAPQRGHQGQVWATRTMGNGSGSGSGSGSGVSGGSSGTSSTGEPSSPA